MRVLVAASLVFFGVAPAARADIFAVSDRILVLRRGRKAGERRIDQTDSDEVVKMMVGG